MPPVEPAPGTEGLLRPVETMRVPDLLSGVCHDLRAPLASIVMGAGFLSRSLAPEDAAALRVVEAIHRAADAMGVLIASFSDLARLGMQDLSLNVQVCDVSAVVRRTFEEVAADALEQGVSVSLDLDPGMPAVPCDPDRMLQLLRHLAASALRVIPEGGSLVVQADGGVTGPARFAMVAKRHPGETARRISVEPPRPAMALARGLVELHGGRLAVVGDGDVLTMSFDLPRAAP